jgi:hypothetical protein
MYSILYGNERRGERRERRGERARRGRGRRGEEYHFIIVLY